MYVHTQEKDTEHSNVLVQNAKRGRIERRRLLSRTKGLVRENTRLFCDGPCMKGNISKGRNMCESEILLKNAISIKKREEVNMVYSTDSGRTSGPFLARIWMSSMSIGHLTCMLVWICLLLVVFCRPILQTIHTYMCICF